MTRKLDLANWKSLPEETLLTVAEAATVLRMSDSKIRKALENEKLPYYRPATDDESNGDYRIMMVDLISYLEEFKGKPKTARRDEESPHANGKPFKHIKPTWSPDASQQQVDQSGR